jgi:hypothetical protein
MERGGWPLYCVLFAILAALVVTAAVAPSPWGGIAVGIGFPVLLILLWWARPPGYNPFGAGPHRQQVERTREALIAAAPDNRKPDVDDIDPPIRRVKSSRSAPDRLT